MQKRKRQTGIASFRAAVVSRHFAGWSVWLFLLLLLPCFVSGAQAGSESRAQSFVLPENLATFSLDPAPAPASEAGARSPLQAEVEYAPLPGEAVSAADTLPERSGSGVKGPEEMAAERARNYKLSQASGAPAESGAPRPVAEQANASESTNVMETVLDGAPTIVPDKPQTFRDMVQLALRQSPYFVSSALEVQKRRIDESDSWWKLLPHVLVTTGYVISGPNYQDHADRFDVRFSTGNYDPLAAGFSIQATKLITEVAILGHMKVINEGIYTLAQAFMRLALYNELIKLQEELVALAKHELTYLDNLQKTGGINPLEARISEHRLEMAVLEKEQLEAHRDKVHGDLKTYLGLDADDPLVLDLNNTKDQVLGYFAPEQLTLAEVKAGSLDLKIEKQQREIQEYSVKLAWASFLPKLFFQVRTHDPIDSTTKEDGLYTSVGLTWDVWDWGERYRNVRRQRMGTKQSEARETIKELDLSSEWRSALSMKRSTLASLKLGRAHVELAGLHKRQSEISYQAGTQPFPNYLSQIREYFVVRKEAAHKEFDDAKAMLTLRYLSGDLFNAYIRAKNF